MFKLKAQRYGWAYVINAVRYYWLIGVRMFAKKQLDAFKTSHIGIVCHRVRANTHAHTYIYIDIYTC